jgi:flagellar motility protein MotE (MotC chaperone)
MDQAAVQEIQKLKRDLLQRVSSQEKNLNDLMTQLARQLVDMPATNAAAQIKALDDEAATRVLAHISTRQRDPILKQLAPKRAKRLNRSLAASAAN